MPTRELERKYSMLIFEQKRDEDDECRQNYGSSFGLISALYIKIMILKIILMYIVGSCWCNALDSDTNHIQ